MKLLVVTRETGTDRRYGLGKSLMPVLDELARMGVETVYLSQGDVTEKNRAALIRFNAYLARVIALLPRCFKKTNLEILVAAFLERINMGRLAVLVASGSDVSHVHCHDPIIALGYKIFRRKYVLFGRNRVRGIKYGITQHGFGSYTQALHEDGLPLSNGMMRLLRNIERKVVTRLDWVIAPTRSCLKQLSRDLACYEGTDHWFAIPHPKNDLSLPGKAEARADLGWCSDRTYLLSVGRIVELKDFQGLVRACAQIVTDKPWSLVVLGDGDRNGLRQYAMSVGLSEEQIIVATTDDIGCWYAAADIYVSSSLTESFGMANHEAICAGMPCILTAVGGVAEMARDSVCYVVPSESELLGRVLSEFINDEQVRNFYAEKARQYAQMWPSTSAIARQYMNCYEKAGVTYLSADGSERGMQE